MTDIVINIQETKKKVTSKYVVRVNYYQQIRGNNLTFLWKKPCNYQQNGKHTR